MPTQSEIDRDYKRLKVLLEATDSFVLTFALYRDFSEQRENAAKLKGLIDLPVTEVELKGDNLNPVYTFLDVPIEPRQAIFYTFLGSSLPEGKSDFDKFAGYVNIQREAFTDAPHAVVLWLREEQLVRLMRRAPDFWAWRSGVFDVRGELQLDTSTYQQLEEVDAFERGELEHQVALYQEILKGQLEREEPDLAYVARTRLRLASAFYKLGLHEEMATEAEEAIKLSKTLKDNELRLDSLRSLAMAFAEAGRYEEAESLSREVVNKTAELFGKEHSDYVLSINSLASSLTNKEHYKEAESLFREAKTIAEATLGKRHPYYVATLNNLANLLEAVGRYDEANLLSHESLGIIEATLGIEHPDYAIALNNIAGLLGNLGLYDEAESIYREAIEVDRKALGEEHPTYASRLNNLATLLANIGRYDEAEQLYRKALAVHTDRYGEDHLNTRLVAENYGILLQELEQTPNP